MKLTDFQRNVYNFLKKIPKGKIATYKILAKAVGKPKNWRQIGKILSQNPDVKEFPCFRVIKSNGEVGGYQKGIKRKTILLKKDGIIVNGDRIRDFKKILFKF